MIQVQELTLLKADLNLVFDDIFDMQCFSFPLYFLCRRSSVSTFYKSNQFQTLIKCFFFIKPMQFDYNIP